MTFNKKMERAPLFTDAAEHLKQARKEKIMEDVTRVKGGREIQEVSMVDAPAWYNSIEASAWAHGYAHALDEIKIQRKWMRKEIEANNAWLPTMLNAFKILHDGTESGQKAALTSVLIEWKELTRTK